MFIPRGKIVYDNLATSYVRVDALVHDLCEGGFSGVVEVLLRNTDSFVVISNGSVAAIIEKSGLRPTGHQPPATGHRPPDELHSGQHAFTLTTLESLAERSRLERGRVSIYSYSLPTARAVAGRINAQPLYVSLSTEFTDLEKMISKLLREHEREWFIEVNTEGVPTTLVHMRDGDCRILTSAGDSTEETSDALDHDRSTMSSSSNNALGKLLYECNRPGTTFDVYIGRAPEAFEASPRVDVEPQSISGFRAVDMLDNGAGADKAAASSERVHSGSLARHDAISIEDAWIPRPLDLIEVEPDPREQLEIPYNVQAAAVNHAALEMAPELKPASDEVSSPDAEWNLIEANALDLALARDNLAAPADGEAMAEVKRLMGEIARTIEEAAQTVDRPESFSMSLRAGQIKVADRYPFLDPFAGDIEYLTGEIVFVGHASVEEFIAGLTEALKLAVEAVMKSTAYPDRFRACVTEDLKNLLARERQALQRFGLDQLIQDMTGGTDR